MRVFDAIDLASLQLAMKSSLAVVLTIGIAFWLDISATIGAITALMIQKPFAASTIQTGIMRLVGGITGWIAALVLLALFPQDRVLFIGSISLATGIWVFFMQGSRYFYALFVGRRLNDADWLRIRRVSPRFVSVRGRVGLGNSAGRRGGRACP